MSPVTSIVLRSLMVIIGAGGSIREGSIIVEMGGIDRSGE
jgi:hypothetical protein